MPAQHGLRPDQDEVTSPVLVEAADEEPEEPVSGAEAGPVLATEGDQSCWRRSRFSRRRCWRLRRTLAGAARKSPRSSIIGAGSLIVATSRANAQTFAPLQVLANREALAGLCVALACARHERSGTAFAVFLARHLGTSCSPLSPSPAPAQDKMILEGEAGRDVSHG
jgi:hypothetical protein